MSVRQHAAARCPVGLAFKNGIPRAVGAAQVIWQQEALILRTSSQVTSRLHSSNSGMDAMARVLEAKPFPTAPLSPGLGWSCLARAGRKSLLGQPRQTSPHLAWDPQ